jgi:hypothetical protein
MQYATEMEKIWAAEDRKGLKLSYPATMIMPMNVGLMMQS